jgi:RimJ/RimL family protein N-acetyltransferase
MPIPDEFPVGAPVASEEARRPRRSALEGVSVRLVPVDPAAHAVALFAASHGSTDAEGLWTYMPYGPFEDPAAMRVWLEGLADSEDPTFLVVVEPATGVPVGMVSFLNVDIAMRRVELGHIWFAPRVQRTTLTTEAVYLLLVEAFDGLGDRRVEWKCDALNARSRAAALRLGFAYEGTFRRHMIVKGRNRDTAWFSMIEEEWPARRAAFDAWLRDPGPGRLAHGPAISP